MRLRSFTKPSSDKQTVVPMKMIPDAATWRLSFKRHARGEIADQKERHRARFASRPRQNRASATGSGSSQVVTAAQSLSSDGCGLKLAAGRSSEWVRAA
jgi:pyridoxine/pyridoxamine 5'-phosphate oxidase